MSKPILEPEAIAFLRERDHFLFFTHNSPDADTVGSASALVLALRAMGKQADAYNREGVPERLSFLSVGQTFLSTLPPLEGRTLVSVDVASPAVLAPQDADRSFALAIDHHKANTVHCERLYVKSEYPAAGELVYELLQAMGTPLTPELAACLYAAISSDSGGFRYASTRPQTMRIAAALMETGIDFADINRRLFEQKTPPQIAAEKLAYEKLELHFDGRFALVTVTAEELAATGASDADTGSLNDIPRQIAGTWLSAVIKPKGHLVKCSLRANRDIDVSAIAARFGGGGHIRAAGFSVSSGRVADVRLALLNAVKEALA